MVWHFPIPAGTFSDPDGDPLTFSARQTNGNPLPAGCTFDPNYNVGGAQGKFFWAPEAQGIFTGDYSFRVTASDGAAAVYQDFTLVIGDLEGLPLFVDLHKPQPKITIYDCIIPASATTALVAIALDKPARETVTWKLATKNADGGAISGNHYTAKTAWVTFHAGEQFKYWPVEVLKALTGTQSIEVDVISIGSNSSSTIDRGQAWIMTQAAADYFDSNVHTGKSVVVAQNPPPGGFTPSPITLLPAVPKTKEGWNTIFNPDLVNDFEATDTGFKADGSTACWYSKPGGGTGTVGREQTANNEDGVYVDPVIHPGTNPFPLVDIGGGVMKRALRSEYLDGLDGRPSQIVTGSKTYKFTASMITTRKLFPTVKTGDYVEARVKVPWVLNTWPAFWMLPANPFVWPPEIDIFEYFLTTLHVDRIQSTIHYKRPDHYGYGTSIDWNTTLGSVFDPAAWHTWGCWVTGTWIIFYIDDIPYMMIPNMCLAVDGPTDWYILLNVAVRNGSPTTNPGNTGDYPADMILDTVKVYRKEA